MSKKYLYNIPGKNFKSIGEETLEELNKAVGKLGQAGIRYDEKNKRVLLFSNNMADITTAVEKQKWEHSRRPCKIEDGWKGYIIPTFKAKINYSGPPHGAEFDIVGKPEITISVKPEWPSEF
jgi:hypothetical protein